MTRKEKKKLEQTWSWWWVYVYVVKWTCTKFWLFPSYNIDNDKSLLQRAKGERERDLGMYGKVDKLVNFNDILAFKCGECGCDLRGMDI